MSEDTEVTQLLDNFQTALDTLNKIQDLEGLMAKLDTSNRRKLLKKVKNIVSDVHSKVSSIKDTVSKTYKKVKVRNETTEEQDSTVADKEDSDKETASNLENCVNEAGRYSPIIRSKAKQRKEKVNKQNDLSGDIVEPTSEEPKEQSEPSLSTDQETTVNESHEITEEAVEIDVAQVAAQTEINGEEKNLNESEVVENSLPIEESSQNAENDSTEVIEEAAEKSDLSNIQEETVEDKDENQDLAEVETIADDKNKVPKIKLVDISKLLANPSSKDVLTTPSPTKSRKSVTFDNSVIVLTSSDEDTPKKNPKKKDPAKLKSALRKTSNKVISISDDDDSDSKENNENLRNQRVTRGKEKISKVLDDDHSSEDPDFVLEDRRSRLTRNNKRKFSKLVDERSRKNKEEKHATRHLEKEVANPARKHSSSKLKSTQTAKKRKKSNTSTSDHESNSSDSSETESANQNSETPIVDLNDPKLKRKLIVKLPKLRCEELPEVYKHKKDSFEIRNPSKTDVANDTADKNRNSKVKNGKPKLTLKLVRRKNKSSSEDENDDNKENDSCSDDSDKASASEVLTDKVTEGSETKKDDNDEQIKERHQESEIASEGEATKETESSDQTEPTKNTEGGDSKINDSQSEKDSDTDENEKGDSSKKLISGSDNSGDSDEDFSKFTKKRDKARAKQSKESKKRTKKQVISDSESGEDNREEKDSDKESNSDNEAAKSQENEEQEKSKSSRKRIKRVRDSSSDEEDKSTRKQIRKMIDRDSLSETTKRAEQDEKDRKTRIIEKQKKYNQIFELKADATVDKVVLDFDEKTNKPLLSVNKQLVKQLKPHQVLGVKFMWDACFESLEQLKKTKGSGCILAHCMGLGKTLQVITLAHTLLTNQDKTKVERILVVCPVNTVLNWKSEFRKWMPDTDDFEVFELVTCKTSSINHERSYIVNSWFESGGILIIGYNMFRTLSNPDNKTISKKLRQSFCKGLVDPGPDLVVCDEGHLLKNEKTNLSIAMNRIKTARRIVLTGTPLQNNLREYWCMVQFIKPNLLGTYKEYLNRFVNPIINGQYTDSTQHDIVVMRRRSHVLHKLLDGVVQRQDYAVLEPYLPPKYEYVLFLKLTEVQIKLYKHYIDNFARRGDSSNRTSFLFADFQVLQRICTHPRVLLDKSIENSKKEKDEDTDSEGSIKEFIDDDDEESATSGSSSNESGSNSGSCDSDASVKSEDKKKTKSRSSSAKNRRARVTRAQAAKRRENGDSSESEPEDNKPKEWWEQYINKDELDNVNYSAKIFLLFQILKECEEIGDKILVFSQSLYTLNCIEYFLARIDEATQGGEQEKVGGHTGSWSLGLDYFRLDGSSSCDNRANWCDQFNNPENTRARLFLISTKAGGLGINLVAANRVIIFDVSWNPSHDIQSIYRVYRFGQTKPSYIYRFVSYGTMEMKIYERQVTKQAISKRVIDEQQIDRHYSQNDIQELYKTDLDASDRPIPLVPKDVLLGEMLQKYDKTIFKYHEHQSLLENKQEEELNEEERKAAWDEFENEKVLRKTSVTNFGLNNFGNFQNLPVFSPQMIEIALGNIIKKDNPGWPDSQIKAILPALVNQLQVQITANDFSMYNRVQQEIRLMQALQAQRMREQYLKQYQLQQMMQKQQLTNQLLGNMNITADDLLRIQMGQASQSRPVAGQSNEVIDLND